MPLHEPTGMFYEGGSVVWRAGGGRRGGRGTTVVQLLENDSRSVSVYHGGRQHETDEKVGS
jgi:hypothetical protein